MANTLFFTAWNQWKVSQYFDPDMVVVSPVDDSAEHDLLSEDCVCKPRVEQHPGGKLIIHNSFDKRELFEDEDGYIRKHLN